MHILLPICGKFTRAQIAHQIFSIETAKFSKPKLKNLLKPVGGQIFKLQFLFLKSSKIFIFHEVMDICVKIIFFKILTNLDSHSFGANYQNNHFRVFFCSLGWFTSIFVKKL
jgi:hypothetical protein